MPRGRSFVSVLIFAGLLFPEAVWTESVRIAVPAPYDELARVWGEASGIPVETDSFKPNLCILQVASGRHDFALLPDPITEGDKRQLSTLAGRVPQIVPVGWEAITIIIHPNNPIPDLRQFEVRQLFAVPGCDEVTTALLSWSQIVESENLQGPIAKLVPRAGTAAAKAVDSILLEDCRLTDESIGISNDAVTERVVAASPESIGLVYRLRHIGRARILPVLAEGQTEPATPSKESMQSGEYPFGRRLWLVSARRYYDPQPAAKFSAFARSPEGQFEVARLGFFPIR